VTSLPDRRASLWTYYDRRAPEYDGAVDGAYRYFRSLGVDVDLEAIRAERRAVTEELARLPPCVFVDVGAGPGVFTTEIPGNGFALDQSENALRRLRAEVGDVPAMRADATALPFGANMVTRLFAGHLYGHLEPPDRATFLSEARRVAHEFVILDSGLPPGARPEEWQTRSLPDGSTHTVYKRHFDIDVLVAEVGGEALFGGRYFVLVRAIA
jgi:ubiquinone/menaquinone biosynthesis C-methylase UbiE